MLLDYDKLIAAVDGRQERKDCLYYTDDWHAYSSLSICGNHFMVDKDKGQPEGRNHLNGIKGSWSYSKHFSCLIEMSTQYFHFYLKETEW